MNVGVSQELDAPADDPQESPDRSRGLLPLVSRLARVPGVLAGLAAAAVLGVFFQHFRPWQGGLLEDWALARAWDLEGLSGFVDRMPANLGRPFHVVPHYLGMAASDGEFVGPYGVLALVAVAQLLGGVWALRALTTRRSVQWTLALALATHPWWAGGDILRFMPAQTATLGVVLWLGAAARYLQTGRRRWMALLVVAPTVGLLAYQGPALALALGGALLAATTAAPRGRRVVLAGATCVVAVGVLAWTAVIAPRLSPGSYEAGLLSTGVDPVGIVRAIGRTMALYAPELTVAALLVALTCVALGFHGRVPAGSAWLLLAAAGLAPLAAVTYASQTLHLNDPERVSMAVGVALWLVLCCAAPALGEAPAIRRVLVGVVLLGSVVGALVDYALWTRFTTTQQSVINEIAAVRDGLPADSVLVMADTGGRLGDVYLFLPPHLDIAVDVQLGEGADAVLCTVDGVPRDHPVAARYPIVSTPDCSAVLTDQQVRPLGSVDVDGNRVELFEMSAR